MDLERQKAWLEDAQAEVEELEAERDGLVTKDADGNPTEDADGNPVVSAENQARYSELAGIIQGKTETRDSL
jgi:hypothetical protein